MEKILTLQDKINFKERIFLNLISKMSKGYISITLPNKVIIDFGDKNSEIKADIQIASSEFFNRLFLYGDIGFGEAYEDKLWETSDITSVISWIILNIENTPSASGSHVRSLVMNLLKFTNTFIHKLRDNTISKARKNISAHYDLSNEFYSLWLDKSMTYSSAYFNHKDSSLYDAQQEKYKMLSEKLKINKGDKILEIGCGWGGMAIYLAKNYDVEVTAITISKEQYHYAQEKVKNECMEDRVKILFIDYRLVNGKYNKIVSIEMLEAVGHRFYKPFFAKINELLTKDGLLALQVITCPDSRFKEMKNGVDWIQKHIFPGSLLPSVSALNKAMNQRSNLTPIHLEDMGKHYAQTLRLWRESFNQKINDINSLGFNKQFIRKWNYYLSYCEAAFDMRNINVMQLLYSRPNNTNY
ncbi:cyclopropane-fatty-acyl-phospholipid synthase family protein [Marinifilum sp. D714]|uniref:SAM-dependent methyltransferase n=1 Tax=Marinifilum sp. D714 TaxID=2937523 RepID=UPI0027CDDFA1|nr:cyclopropane-fatty-acyl-phospholipid synthase family protein [Marinifilum sp. D714]MDQ2178194.1 cyclopropane-fatty-acyl-phospholipid synthase family protein [Marinifilum sp. D714]